VIAILAVTVTIPLLLAFQKWRRKHHKNLELIVSETPPSGETGIPQLPCGRSVTSTGPDQTEVATTMIVPSELLARENRYRETPRQRELPPAGPPRRVKDPEPSPATKTAIENLKRPNPTLMHLEKPDSGPPASAANKVTELRTVNTPALRPARQ
jgi:hypothetical protein